MAMDISEGNQKALKIFSDYGFSRIPVFKDDYSEIIGILHAKDFFPAISKTPILDWKNG